MRKPGDYAPAGLEHRSTTIVDARAVAGQLGLERSGFALYNNLSSVVNWFDANEVIDLYYAQCKELACTILGASHAFTFDHLIREPNQQTAGGGVNPGADGGARVTGAAQGGGYVGAVHMDYTENTTWASYLNVHGLTEPRPCQRIVALNFWRPLTAVVEDQPLAVCDARTPEAADLFETVVYGYGADNYSWHNLGIETYNVKASPAQHWYYYPRMCHDEVLVFKSFDSRGVIGNACAYAAFQHPAPAPDAPARCSIELRVLCYITD
jgi:hypothetical protein